MVAIAKEEVEEQTVESITFESIGPLLCRTGTWDEDIVRESITCYDLDVVQGEPRVILDIGCHIGSFMRRAAARWPAAIYLGIEPWAENVALCEYNIQNLDRRHVFYGAISSNRDHDWSYVECPVTPNTGGGAVIHGGGIPSVLVSDIIRLFGPIDLIKTDCENAEWIWMHDLIVHDLMDQVTAIVGEAHNPEWQTMLHYHLSDTHDITRMDTHAEGEQNLGYFTARLK